MTYQSHSYAQDASAGRVGQMLDCIGATATAVTGFDTFDAAVAYASSKGVDILVDRLAQNADWGTAAKRLMISMDFGITEPQALVKLAALSNSEVRIPNASVVLSNKMLAPRTTFHAKAYLIGRASDVYPCGVALGSANMTASALLTGSEVFSGHVWSGTPSKAERDHHVAFSPLTDWFDDAWSSASPLSSVLSAYKALYRSSRLRRPPGEDRGGSVKTYLDAQAIEITGELAVQLQSAKCLWVKTERLYGNLRGGTIGNQLDTPRGTRLFFGFPGRQVPKNHIFGHIEVKLPGRPGVSRSVRFGNNFMDKVNLPVPGPMGPATYDHSFLLFERGGKGSLGLARFDLTVTDIVGLNARKARAINSVDLHMAGGRPYGLLF